MSYDRGFNIMDSKCGRKIEISRIEKQYLGVNNQDIQKCEERFCANSRVRVSKYKGDDYNFGSEKYKLRQLEAAQSGSNFHPYGNKSCGEMTLEGRGHVTGDVGKSETQNKLGEDNHRIGWCVSAR